MKDMLGDLVRKLVGLPLEFLKVIYDLVEKLSGEAGQKWLTELKKFLRKEKCWVEIAKQNLKVYLREIFQNEIIELGPDEGTRMLADAKDTFRAGVDSDFVNWGLNKKRSPKAKIQVRVHEMIEDGNFGQLFGSLFGASPEEFKSFSEFFKKYREDLRKLCVGQAQIEDFAVNHRDKLRGDGCGTFFLTEDEDTGEFFVVCVLVDSGDGLYVSVFQFEDDDVWLAVNPPRFVVPRLA